MRNTLLLASTCLAFSLTTSPATAQEESPWSFELGVATSYIGGDFNQEFSDESIIQASVTYNFTDYFYANAYLYSGFDSIFDSQSSEYGGELGFADVPLFWVVEGSLAVGHYGNYNGLGADVGDWFVRPSLAIGDLSLWHTVLFDDTDGTATGVSYELSLTESLSVSPSVVYLDIYDGTWRAWNPGLSASYAFSDNGRVDVMLVYPENDLGDREFAGNIGLFFEEW